MKCLSLKQPWARLMFHGKPIENRKWKTEYRGPLLIHASMNCDKEGELWIRQNFPKTLPEICFYPRGVIIGRVDLVDCVESHPSPWFFGPYGFVFENPVEFKMPIPWRGMLGLFEVPEGVRGLKNE